VRILIVNQYYPPDVANSAKMLAHLVEALEARHEVTVIAGRPSYNSTALSQSPPGRVVRVPSTSFGRASLPGRALNYASYMLMSLARVMVERRPDLVLTMTDPPIVGLLGVAAAARFRRPLVQVSHDVYPEIAVALGAIARPRLIGAWRALNRTVRNRTAGIVVVGRGMEDLLAEQGVPRSRLHYVPMWADDQPASSEQQARARAEMKWQERFVVMHAGNLGPAQNLDTLLGAAALTSGDPRVLFVFMGDGAARAHLQRRAAEERLDNVDFLDYLPQERAQELMAAADVHVVSLAPGLGALAAPSKTYGILAAGRPYIAAVDPVAEPARIVDEEGCGVACSPGDSAALASAIREIQEKPLAEMAERARDAFERRFRRAVVTDELVGVIEGIAAGADPRDADRDGRRA
jgi:colanic acid biosynthesis glycosyl transferase WcaI